METVIYQCVLEYLHLYSLTTGTEGHHNAVVAHIENNFDTPVLKETGGISVCKGQGSWMAMISSP